MKSNLRQFTLAIALVLLGLGCSLFDGRPIPSTSSPGVSTLPSKPGATPAWGAPAMTMLYQDPDGFYSLEYPDDWQVMKSGSQQQFCTDNKSMICFAVSVMRVSSAKDLLADDSVFLAKKMENYVEGKQTDLTISGYAGGFVEHSYRWRGINFKGFIAAAARNRVGFELMAWAPEQDYPKLKETFLEILQTFDIIEYESAPDYGRWKSYRSSRLDLRYLPGSWVEKSIADIAAQHEKAYDAILKALQVDFKGSVTIYLYPSREVFFLSTSEEAGFALPSISEVHVRWYAPNDHQTYGHELTHIITAKTIGNPTEALLGEGIAVCLDQENRDYRLVAKDLSAKNLWLPLGELLGNQWGKKDIGAAYSQSGVVACYLLEQFGSQKFKQLYVANNFSTALPPILGVDLAGLEKNLQSWRGK